MQNKRLQDGVLWYDGLTRGLADFAMLVKFRLTLLVLFSAAMSYAIAANGQVQWLTMAKVVLGGFLVTGAANALNQVLERDFDKLMDRTKSRPLAAGRMAVHHAVSLSGLMALLGITLLTSIHPLAGFWGTVSLISYAFIYTPMKRSSVLAVVVGAVPGALPLIIGVIAFDGWVSPLALSLFTVQFLWQFPHFWAVAWLADEDYKKAGFRMLPTPDGEKSSLVGLLSMAFCLLLVGNVLLSWYLEITGLVATALLVLLNLYFAHTAWRLYRECSREAARRQMFASFIHLPFTLIIMLIERMV